MNEFANFGFELCKLLFARHEQLLSRQAKMSRERSAYDVILTVALSTAVTNFLVFLPGGTLRVISIDSE